MAAAGEKLPLSLRIITVQSLVSMRSGTVSSADKMNMTGIILGGMTVPTAILPRDVPGGPTF